MDIQFERKINTNRWMLKARWFYSIGVFLIGYLTKVISNSNVNLSFALMFKLFIIFVPLNLSLFYILKIAKQKNSTKLLGAVSYIQIIMDLCFAAYILHSAGGIESISSVFFFLPIVSSTLIFRAQGAIITAVISSLIINFSAIAEYTGLMTHISRYGVDTLEYLNLSITLTKTITISVFYLVVGFFAGYGADLLYEQEKLFTDKSRELHLQTKILAEREKELTEANQETKSKIQELERFQKQVVGRELQMIKLKKEIAELTEKINIQK